ncbi:MAG: DUF3800 domain-containing protein, partial [Methanosarcinaceae archaeon]|nr:DUF3800 domain-containing protein [Methanosarcinaceae archaeon]
FTNLIEMVSYIFIDESGDLGSQSKYLILSALVVKSPDKLNRIIKNMRRTKFKKQLRNATEIKANRSSPELVKYVLKKLNDLDDAKVFFIILEKEKCYSTFLNSNKHKLYNFVAGKLASNINVDDGNVIVRIDKSKGKQVLRDDFNKYFEYRLKDNSLVEKVEIHHSYSHAWAGLQFADVLSWSAFQKMEHSNNEYIDVLKIRIEVYEVW